MGDPAFETIYPVTVTGIIPLDFTPEMLPSIFFRAPNGNTP
jgi:hypothetical protein